ncbi:MAG: hypothetical protein ACO3SP_07775, partial [Ilumatobacteraceae bacterium]
FNVRAISPLTDSPEAAAEARRRDHLVWRTFLRGLRDGTVVIPGRADRELPDLAGAIDIVGIGITTDLGSDRLLDDDTLRRCYERTQMFLHRAAEEGPNMPMAVTYRARRPLWADTDRDGEVLTETFVRSLSDTRRDGVPITQTFFEPGIAPISERGRDAFLDWDRQITASGTAWRALAAL